MKKDDKLKRMVIISLFAAIMCILAPFTIPLGFMPLSLSTFVLYLTAVMLGRIAVFPILLYILIGAVGLPVFAGGMGGIERLFGPTGGFILGYIPCAVVSGFMSDARVRSKLSCFFGLLIGTVIMYSMGIPWMCYILGAQGTSSAFSVVAVNVLPFVPIDLAKMGLALVIGRKIRQRLNK